ncbi:ABC-type transport system involved in multi-copper enzyme maturation, permease component [Methanocella conradii HZ254]|uniref:ABC-type transport system involved in multi-copper enzyme maturation, permease component n=1 Tax=Methanocella conradii (strain DSM 24694 / JCM 17849 / CGMCC 1.5162 / HZ254) TaxID=1041930 RepID=H8I8L7_METCZ|nr:ABC transporter permease subunit [Methanocella conradii]AFC99493.1 ABC-type transport system involved in multi-copper enzyme maturation, permease component [Methanocella conradii HZ254]
MRNTLVIASKEFRDLLSNRMVLFVLVAFTVYAISTVYKFYSSLNGNNPNISVEYRDNLGVSADYTIFYMLSWFGCLIGIVIGCSTIASERMGHALNTLLVKPVYRDTIINGKFLGSFAFLASVLVFLAAIFTACFFVLCGGALAPFLFDYFARLPFVLAYAMVSVSVFLSVSMLISVIVRDQEFAMILSVVAVYISEIIPYPDIAINLNNVFPGHGLTGMVIGLSPVGIMHQAHPVLMDTSASAIEAFLGILPDLFKLLVYVVIAIFLCYIVFLWRDVS